MAFECSRSRTDGSNLDKAYSRADETDLVLAGFVSFADPVLPDVADVLAELKQDGVTVKILTGDNDLVARHVCRRIGFDDHEIVTGEELAHLDDAALGHVAEQAAAFARVSPAQKNRIIMALKRRGHVVGFMGDGINDAPSLHTADVGISVMTGADVARDAADIILGKPSLKVLHRGILEGRRPLPSHDGGVRGYASGDRAYRSGRGNPDSAPANCVSNGSI